MSDQHTPSGDDGVFVAHLRTHLLLSLDMLDRLIAICPPTIWDKTAGGFPFWQQILHALTGTLFWTRPTAGDFHEPFAERHVFPELDGTPEDQLTKEELSELSGSVRRQIATLLAHKDEAWLKKPNCIYNGILNVDAIVGQIRHLQYHVGHCNSILREHNEQAEDWLDYFGEDNSD
jgi:hypothetical protein